VTTNWKKRGQALRDKVPHLTVKSAAAGPNFPGHPVSRTNRGTVYADRNPMHDTEPKAQEEGAKDPIRTQLVQRGVK
jgi:hypothetical protein